MQQISTVFFPGMKDNEHDNIELWTNWPTFCNWYFKCIFKRIIVSLFKFHCTCNLFLGVHWTKIINVSVDGVPPVWSQLPSHYSNGLMHVRSNSIALAMKLRLSCTKPSIEQGLIFRYDKFVWLSTIPYDFEGPDDTILTGQRYLAKCHRILSVNLQKLNLNFRVPHNCHQ